MSVYEKMSNQQLVKEFYKIWEQFHISRSNINRYIKNHFSQLYDEIEHRTSILNQYKAQRSKDGKIRDISIFERIYFLNHNLVDRPFCIECKQKHVSGFMPFKNEYSLYCSQDCQKHSSIQAYKGRETKKIKYGEDNIVNQKKAYKTRMMKYGSYNPKDQSLKAKATKLKKYGNENYVNTEKCKETIEKHKAENPNFYVDIHNKIRQTNISNGRDPNWNNREKFKDTISHFSSQKKECIKNKRKQTCLEEYGYEYATQNEDVKAKTKQTCIELYGVQCALNTSKAYKNMTASIREKAWEQLKLREMDIQPMFTKDQFIEENNESKEWRWKCKKCGHEFMHAWKGINSHCPECFKHNFMGMQNEILSFIKIICKDDVIKANDRKIFNNELEIDILDTTKMIGVEINGLIWHNVDKAIYGQNRIGKMYHSSKTDLCMSKGIRLIHLFEDEWLEHKKLCMSKLKKILCPEKMRKIDAHRCSICKEISCSTKEKLLTKYTFYGCDGSSIAYALKHKGKIVAMMTLSKTKKDTIHEWQILNYIEMNSVIVENGFNVLLKAFCNDFKTHSISYYLSRDWNLPEDIIENMSFSCINAPKMFWTKKQQRFKNSHFDKKDLKSFLDVVDDNKSFIQNMNDNGYYRIYDSGTMMFEMQQG